MKSLFARMRCNGLQLMLALLLPLHAGLAQAVTVMPAPAAVTVTVQHAEAGDEVLMPDGMPCHHEVQSLPAPDKSTPHKGGCCATGDCHCAVACGLPLAIVRISPQPESMVLMLSHLAVPADSRPPDLRPPID
ncbi:MAG: hypothetical protein U1F39_07135 [Steroidobacteraceae bacterium]